MIWDVIFLGCAGFGLWHFARATYTAFKHDYIMWSYSRSSSGSRVYKSKDARRYWIGAWANIAGLAFMVPAACLSIFQIAQRLRP